MRAPLVLCMRAGRLTDGAERGHGTRIHARPANQYPALCGAKPGRRSGGWVDPPDGATAPTCPRCARLAALEAAR
jgi:hypothetical protein